MSARHPLTIAEEICRRLGIAEASMHRCAEEIAAAMEGYADARVSAAVELETQRCVALCYAEAAAADARIAAEPMASERFVDYWRRQQTCAKRLAKRLRTAAPAGGGGR